MLIRNLSYDERSRQNLLRRQLVIPLEWSSRDDFSCIGFVTIRECLELFGSGYVDVEGLDWPELDSSHRGEG